MRILLAVICQDSLTQKVLVTGSQHEGLYFCGLRLLYWVVGLLMS
ncbi:hypothetical protein Hdeb2414_s0009g00325461 [Helianthus debilis subsp. tardiflorus]